MAHSHVAMLTDRRLRLFKWLMVLIPPATLAIGHTMAASAFGRHADAETLLITLLVALLALALAHFFAEAMLGVLRRSRAEALARQHEVLTMSAVMAERERLSRELHDGAAQLVSHLLLRLDTITALVEEGRRDEAASELARLREVADEIYEDIGESITGLRTDITEHGLVRALEDYAERFEERYGLPVTLHADDVCEEFPPLAAFQIFRFVQEALANVRKHAGARGTTVTLTADGAGGLRVVVKDEGRGFAPDGVLEGRSRPLGLTSMRERVEALGGVFRVESRPGWGTEVSATIPLT